MPNLERMGYRIESYIVEILTKLDNETLVVAIGSSESK